MKGRKLLAGARYEANVFAFDLVEELNSSANQSQEGMTWQLTRRVKC